MIPQAAEFQVDSNIKGHVVEMGFDPAAKAHLMNVMTDLYEDREMAVLRELSTNARDSHVESGNGDPIEVWTPSPLAPMLRIVDHGIGMDRQTIEQVFSMYGASTKRGSNDFNGMLGLGCKSPLTYTPQFTLTGVKDGTLTTVSISREEEGGGTMTILDERPTSDPNGVTITVPVKGVNAFDEKAKKLFRYWPEGSVLLNGETPERVDGLWVVPGRILLERHAEDPYRRRRGYSSGRAAAGAGHKEDVIVMGNVPYSTDLGLTDAYGVRAVAFVDTGDVTFAPSREGLTDTPLTTKRIERIKQEFADNAASCLQRQMVNVGTRREALKLGLELREQLPGAYRPSLADLRFRGEPLPDEFVGAPDFIEVKLRGRYGYGHCPLKEYMISSNLAVGQWAETLWVEGYDRPSYTDTQRKKLDRFTSNLGLDTPVARYVLLKPNMKAPRAWLDPTLVVKWDDVWATQLNTKPVNPNPYSAVPARLPGSYDVWDDAKLSTGVAADDLKNDTLYYVAGALTETQRQARNYGKWEYRKMVAAREYAEWLSTHKHGAKLVQLTEQRVEKFKRTFPKACEIKAYIELVEKQWVATLTDRERTALTIVDYGRMYVHGYEPGPSTDRHNLAQLDPARIDDPDLKELVEACRTDVTDKQKLLRRFHGIKREPITQAGLNGHLSGYPLMSTRDAVDHTEHVYTYINAAYAANKEESA